MSSYAYISFKGTPEGRYTRDTRQHTSWLVVVVGGYSVLRLSIAHEGRKVTWEAKCQALIYEMHEFLTDAEETGVFSDFSETILRLQQKVKQPKIKL